MDEFAERLHEYLSGRMEPSGDGELRALAELARAVGSLPFPEAGPERVARLRARFRDYVDRYHRPRRRDWILGWLGAGPRPRPLLQRAAVGLILVAAAFSGGTVAAGETPLAVLDRAAEIAQNAARNLLPRDGTPAPTPAGETTPTPTPSITTSPTPLATPSPEPDPTPEGGTPAREDRDDGGEDRERSEADERDASPEADEPDETPEPPEPEETPEPAEPEEES